MNKTQAKLLAKLADRVEEKNERFYFGSWVGNDYQGHANLSCGTTACALGWGTTMPSLRRLGLRLAKIPDWGDGGDVAPFIERGNRKIYSISSIGKILFGITADESRMLFVPDNGFGSEKLTGKEWARQARAFIITKFVKGERVRIPVYVGE